MLIVPSQHEPRGRFLLPMRRREWMPPSQRRHLRSDDLGRDDRTWCTISARAPDGSLAWRGDFNDREDADAFLWAALTGSLAFERALWRLPEPWYPGDFPFPVTWYVATNVTLTSGAGSGNQTYSVPSDYASSGSQWHAIGAGASGGGGGSGSSATGGGGAGGSKEITVALTPSGTATYNIGSGGAAQTANAAGNNGNDCYFNGTTLAGSSVGAKGGTGGAQGSGAQNGGTGGASASGVGSTKNSGGRGGNVGGIHSSCTTGGGGAGGPNGAGNTGVDTTSSSQNTAGGSGDAGSGGSAGAGSGGTGGNGSNLPGGIGPGGGGGGNTTTGGNGGNYGGGGGASNGLTRTSGAGIQGCIAGSYTPRNQFRRPSSLSLGAGGPFYTDPLTSFHPTVH